MGLTASKRRKMRVHRSIASRTLFTRSLMIMRSQSPFLPKSQAPLQRRSRCIEMSTGIRAAQVQLKTNVGTHHIIYISTLCLFSFFFLQQLVYRILFQIKIHIPVLIGLTMLPSYAASIVASIEYSGEDIHILPRTLLQAFLHLVDINFDATAGKIQITNQWKRCSCLENISTLQRQASRPRPISPRHLPQNIGMHSWGQSREAGEGMCPHPK